LHPPDAGAARTDSPTITSLAMTMRGVILGTAANMAPEPAKGKGADRCSDLWAFGCVLYGRFVGVVRQSPGGDSSTSEVRVVQHWVEELKRLAPGR
jgi:serine/threonine protein kinase